LRDIEDAGKRAYRHQRFPSWNWIGAEPSKLDRDLRQWPPPIWDSIWSPFLQTKKKK
jgi:hypothetical protein